HRAHDNPHTSSRRGPRFQPFRQCGWHHGRHALANGGNAQPTRRQSRRHQCNDAARALDADRCPETQAAAREDAAQVSAGHGARY
ncbi:hypothetical protein BN1723_020379, partial [Verticillium longisporum]